MKKKSNIFRVFGLEGLVVEHQTPSIQQNFQISVILFIFQFLKSRFEKDEFAGRVIAEYVTNQSETRCLDLVSETVDRLYLYFPLELDFSEVRDRALLIPSCTIRDETLEFEGGNEENFLVLDIKNPHFFFFQKTQLTRSIYQYLFWLLLFILFFIILWLLIPKN